MSVFMVQMQVPIVTKVIVICPNDPWNVSVHGASRPYKRQYSAPIRAKPPMNTDMSVFMTSHTTLVQQAYARIETTSTSSAETTLPLRLAVVQSVLGGALPMMLSGVSPSQQWDQVRDRSLITGRGDYKMGKLRVWNLLRPLPSRQGKHFHTWGHHSGDITHLIIGGPTCLLCLNKVQGDRAWPL